MLKLVKIHEKMGQKCPKIGKIRQFLTKFPCVCEISAWSGVFYLPQTGFTMTETLILEKKILRILAKNEKFYALFEDEFLAKFPCAKKLQI